MFYFQKGFQIRKFTVNASLVDGYKTEIELFKDERMEVIKSVEEDLAHAILKFNDVTKSNVPLSLLELGTQEDTMTQYQISQKVERKK